jgi:hypothetical protein
MNISETVVFLVKGTDIRHWNRRHDSIADSAPPPALPEGPVTPRRGSSSSDCAYSDS